MMSRSMLWAGASAAALLTGAPAVAQSSDAEVIVVTGTRTAGRSALDTPVPVDVVSVGELSKTGLTELNQALASSLPSFNFPLPSITDGTDHVRPATLRGLGPDQTLVLVNSKRRHASALVNINGSVGRGSSAVDLNTIPTAAIGSVQVLRDGASAQYGSDAIAGVINVLLKEESEGGAVSVTYGQHLTDVETPTRTVNVAGLAPFEVGGEREETDGETLTVSGWKGFSIGDQGFLTVSAEYRDRQPSNRAGLDPRQQYALVGGAADPSEAGFDRLNHRYGNAEVKDLSVFANAGYTLDAGAEFYGFASAQQRDGESGGFYRRAQDGRNVLAIYPDGFLPLIVSDVTDLSGGVGVRGQHRGWDMDLSVTTGSNQLNYRVENSLNTSLGAASPTEFDAGSLEYDQTTLNFDVVRGFDVGNFASPLNVAAGFEFRSEDYTIGAGELASYVQGAFPGAAGSQVFPGFQPANSTREGRDSAGIYLDLEADVTERLTLSGAVRFEDYEDFGDTTTGKLAARFQLTDWLALRGAASTGFRAPSLQQAFFTTTSTNFINQVQPDGSIVPIPEEVGTFAATSPEAVALGAQPLDAEESVNFSAGFVVDSGNFSLTVDAYQIDIEDRIVLSENLGGAGRPDIVALLPEGVTRARFFINGVDTETQGVDIVGKYGFDGTAYGDFDVTLGANFTDTEVTAVPSTDVLSALTPPPVLFGRREVARFEVGQPDSKIVGSVDWALNRWGATLRATRYGETIDPGTAADGSGDEILSAKTLVDLEGRFDVGNGVRLALGANNLLDEYPDLTDNDPRFQGGTFTGIFPYSGFSPFGFNGRFVYARASYEF